MSNAAEETEPSEDAAPPPPLHVGPDHRDMYLLLAGLVVGLLLSPFVMSRVMEPETFDKWYYGGAKETDAYAAFLLPQVERIQRQGEEKEAKLKGTDVTPEAIAEMWRGLNRDAEKERLPFTEAIAAARLAHTQWVQGFAASLIVAAVLLMFIEPIFEPAGRTAAIRRRLVTGRYALLAAWLATVLVKPAHLSAGSLPFVALLLGVAMLAAALPWLLAGRE